MTVRNMIQQLTMFPMDTQVVDTYGSPIMYMLYHNHDKNSPVRLEPKSEMDINEELQALFNNAVETAESDIDTLEDLIERGYTAEDLKEYNLSTYVWAESIAQEYGIDFN